VKVPTQFRSCMRSAWLAHAKSAFRLRSKFYVYLGWKIPPWMFSL